MNSNREYGVTKIPTSLVSHIICFFVAVAFTVIASIYSTPEISTFGGFVKLPLESEWYSSVPAIITNGVMTILLVIVVSAIANKFSLTTLLSLFPTLFLLMLQCCNPAILLNLNIGILGAISLMVSTYYLFENYGKRRGESVAFDVTLLMCATSLLWDKALFFIPLLWIGLAQLNILNIKSAVASIFAIVTAAFILWASSYLGLYSFAFAETWSSLKSVMVLDDYNHVSNNVLYDMAYIAPILIVVLVYNLANIYADSHEKISIKRYALFLNTALIVTVLLMALNPLSITAYMPVLSSVSALLAAHYFNTIKSKFKLRFLYIVVLTYVAMFLLWIL